MTPSRRAQVVELLRCAAWIAITRADGLWAITRAGKIGGFSPTVEADAVNAELRAFPGHTFGTDADGRRFVRLLETALLVEEGALP